MSQGMDLYVAHLYFLAVQAGFYSDTVECWIFVQRVAGLILSRVRSDDLFFTCYRETHYLRRRADR